MALAIGPPVIIPFLLFGGFFLNNRYRPLQSASSCDAMRTVNLKAGKTVIAVVRFLALGKISHALGQ
jgi:hypothetical protein